MFINIFYTVFVRHSAYFLALMTSYSIIYHLSNGQYILCPKYTHIDYVKYIFHGKMFSKQTKIYIIINQKFLSFITIDR